MSNRNDQLAPQVGALLREAWGELHAEVIDGLSQAGFDDLRPAHRPLLNYALTEELRPSELAARLGLSKQVVNDLLRELEDRGYVQLVPDPGDGRAKRLQLTPRGRRLGRIGSKLSQGVGERWAQQVGSDRYATFEAVLQEIVTNGRAHGLGQPRS